jgi:hypothetical protein
VDISGYRYVCPLTFITVADPAMLWDCDLRIRLVVGADLCTRRGLVDCGRGVGDRYAVSTAMDAAIAGHFPLILTVRVARLVAYPRLIVNARNRWGCGWSV